MVDQPHPLTVRQIILCCAEADIEGAIQNLRSASLCVCLSLSLVAAGSSLPRPDLWNLGYAPIDIVGTLFRVTKTAEINERLKLSFVKVIKTFAITRSCSWTDRFFLWVLQEIGFAHMRIADGCSTLLQLTGLISRLCQATV